MTGLPCSGKSTLAVAIARWVEASGARVAVLDGDVLRSTVSSDLGYGEADRVTQAARVVALAQAALADGHHCVIAATISPYLSARAAARVALGPAFVELHVDTPAEVCARRDVKGQWARARAGELADFTGVSAPYEPPETAELTVHTECEGVAEAAQRVASFVLARLG